MSIYKEEITRRVFGERYIMDQNESSRGHRFYSGCRGKSGTRIGRGCYFIVKRGSRTIGPVVVAVYLALKNMDLSRSVLMMFTPFVEHPFV